MPLRARRRSTLALDVLTMAWREFSMGSSIGTVGSEGGAIVADESYEDRARITLERSTRLAPYAVTCGVSGWLVHTRFFESEAEARSQFDAMKAALAHMTDAVKSVDDVQPNDTSLIGRLCQAFVEEFP
jgi:hypothetical protein